MDSKRIRILAETSANKWAEMLTKEALKASDFETSEGFKKIDYEIFKKINVFRVLFQRELEEALEGDKLKSVKTDENRKTSGILWGVCEEVGIPNNWLPTNISMVIGVKPGVLLYTDGKLERIMD